MHRLRSECPWDKEQTLETLRAYLLEEAYECAGAMKTAVEHSRFDELYEELGDVLLQVVFQCEILSEISNSKAIERVIDTLNQKLVRRHPHVFGENKVTTAERALAQWDQIKREENSKKGPASKSSFDSIAKSLTAVQRSEKIGSRSKKLAFDWSNSEEVWSQFLSEVDELKRASSQRDREQELGDVFFSLVQWARHMKIDPEVSLHEANEKFMRRFKKMLELSGTNEDQFKDLSLEQKENLWKRVKALES